MTFVVTRQRAQEVHDRARARAGLSYAYGGAFTLDPRRSTDCSGLVFQTAAWYGGRTDWVGNRYGSTESFRLDHKVVYDLGFKRLPPGGVQALPFKPVMLVGLQHGGGGRYSHTACTLMTMDVPGGPVKMSDRGVDWESQGDGVFLYDGARAWNDRLFHDFWYLDAKLEGNIPEIPDSSNLTRAEQYALRIIAECRRLGITPRGTKIALAVGLVETNLTMYANRKDPASLQLPHDKVGEDHDSSGIYQQRPPWGAIQDRMNVEASTRIFLTADKGPGVRGLLKIRDANGRLYDYNDTSRTPGTYAQKVQGSQYPDRYDQRFAEAERLYNKLTNLTPADPIEELLTMKAKSWSIYRTPGEGEIPVVNMICAIDAYVHRTLTDEDALTGDADAIRRVALTAGGRGDVRTPGAISHAVKVLNEIYATNPAAILAATPGKA